jgi:serine/threonine protein kinase
VSPIVAGGQLGRYRILRLLGAGAMGEVFLAEDPHIGRRVAIKTVKIEDGRPNEMAERKRRLERESRAAGKLLHPYVVALFDVGEDAGVLYLAFECVDGSDLAQRLEVDPPITLREAITYVRQAAEGLDYAHRQGIVHRDIKPSNLLISASSGTVKVSDFGIAKLKDQTSDLTMTGSVVGSPHYLSPEQIRGDELDGRSDVFSLGVLFYEILSRRRPFEGETLTTLVYQILHRDPPSIVVNRPELGTRLENVLQRMLQKERDERYATAGEVARDLAICEQEIPASILDSPAARDSSFPVDQTRRMSTSERAAQVVPPPPPGRPSPTPISLTQAPTETMSARALSSPPGTGGADTAYGRTSSRTGLWLVGAVVAVALGALVVGGLATRRWIAAKQAQKQVQQVAAAAQTNGSASPDPAGRNAAPVAVSTAPDPSAQEAEKTSTTSTDRQEPAADPGERFRQSAPPAPAPAREPSVPPREEPRSEPNREPAREPADESPRRPAPSAPPVVNEPEPEPADESPEVNEPVIDRAGLAPRIDRMMVTGMALSFVVEPPEAIVKIDGRVIGQAGTWNAKKRDGRAYDLPDSGDHIVRITHEGRAMTIRVSASDSAPSPTLVSVDLRVPNEKSKRSRRSGDRP